jgi:pimeloyl-ACP methyl ester carboxylesterase
MRFLKSLIISLAIPATFVANATDSTNPSVVLVHGAFADGSDWAKVIPFIREQNIHVTAVQNRLTSLDDDVAVVRRAIDGAPGKVVLVGHSWGGAVISQAGAHEKVAGLVYVAAFAPDVGQTVAETGKAYPTPPGLAHVKADNNGFLRLTDVGVSQYFAQDLPSSQAAIMASTQGPVAFKVFGEKLSTAAWKNKPSWYLIARQDRMIQPDLQRHFARTMGAKVTEADTSHVPHLSVPNRVAEIILEAVKQLK